MAAWISDLLRNASGRRALQRPASEPVSRPAAERNPRHVVESLNSLSVDIARAIDHDAASISGAATSAANATSSPAGSIRSRASRPSTKSSASTTANRSSGNAVDRYIADFEKLLADVARNDRDKVLTQTYLTSDTGKVYTMLAHAAGRLS